MEAYDALATDAADQRTQLGSSPAHSAGSSRAQPLGEGCGDRGRSPHDGRPCAGEAVGRGIAIVLTHPCASLCGLSSCFYEPEWRASVKPHSLGARLQRERRAEPVVGSDRGDRGRPLPGEKERAETRGGLRPWSGSEESNPWPTNAGAIAGSTNWGIPVTAW